MAIPSTDSEYLDLVRRSGVLESEVLQEYTQKQRDPSAAVTDPKQRAADMIKAGLLTPFQAKQLLLGRSRLTLAGKYRLLECLGTGGMGAVYLCEHKHMHRRVALKVLPYTQAANKGSLERFYREARAVARLHHPNIVAAHDVDNDGKNHFIVLEYVDGNSLEHIVKKQGPMDVTRACHYIAQAAVGLQHAHEAGLVHRDIKPPNLLVDRTGTVKILDLGLARFFHDSTDDLTNKYDPNMVMGTIDYLAPEQAVDSHAVDIRADIYSLGLTFYFLLAGRGPFGPASTAQKLLWQQVKKPQPVREVRPEVPEGVAAVLEQMTAKEPGNRYQTPAEVVEALATWIATPIAPPPDEEMPILAPGLRGPERGEAVATPSLVRGNPVTPRSPGLPSVQAPRPARPTTRRKSQRVAWVAMLSLVLLGAGGVVWWMLSGQARHDSGTTVAATTQANPSPPNGGTTPLRFSEGPVVPRPGVGQGVAWTWASYDAVGTLVKDNVAVGTTPQFTIPAGETLYFVTRAPAPLRLEAMNASAKVSFSFSATAGLKGTSVRALGFGLFNCKNSTGEFHHYTGYFVLWNPSGPYFESYARGEGKDLFSGKQLRQGGTYEGMLVDDATYTGQLQLNRTASGDGIGMGTNGTVDLAGVVARGPGVNQLAYSRPVIPLLGNVTTFDTFAIKFHNTASRDARLSLHDLACVQAPEK
jgi:serine/threonine protein kinase